MAGRSNFLRAMLHETAVWWANAVNTGEGGRSFAEPVEIAVRWEERGELYIDAAGQEKRSSAVIFSSEEVKVGDYLYLGTLGDLSSADPLLVAAAYEVKAIAAVPNANGSEHQRNAYL